MKIDLYHLSVDLKLKLVREIQRKLMEGGNVLDLREILDHSCTIAAWLDAILSHVAKQIEQEKIKNLKGRVKTKKQKVIFINRGTAAEEIIDQFLAMNWEITQSNELFFLLEKRDDEKGCLSNKHFDKLKSDWVEEQSQTTTSDFDIKECVAAWGAHENARDFVFYKKMEEACAAYKRSKDSDQHTIDELKKENETLKNRADHFSGHCDAKDFEIKALFADIKDLEHNIIGELKRENMALKKEIRGLEHEVNSRIKVNINEGHETVMKKMENSLYDQNYKGMNKKS